MPWNQGCSRYTLWRKFEKKKTKEKKKREKTPWKSQADPQKENTWEGANPTLRA